MGNVGVLGVLINEARRRASIGVERVGPGMGGSGWDIAIMFGQ